MAAYFSVLVFAFTLVCVPRENLSLAEITLQHLTPYLLLSLHLLNPNTRTLLYLVAKISILETGLVKVGKIKLLKLCDCN